VWASKWNERAYLSRAASGIADKDLFMAVLVQQVVEADYSYVIHTVNPFTGKRDEVYAEAVMGLGEVLVGNYPGRALSFRCAKKKGMPTLLSFPSKSTGLYGGGLIFRSDSNGEDLAGFAGAGLYDSFLVQPAQKVTLDYIQEPLVWDDHFRTEFMSTVAKIGAEVEKMLGSPQDIEGACSKGNFFVVQSRPQVGIENG
jgi:alpha-glucan,water dikinase